MKTVWHISITLLASVSTAHATVPQHSSATSTKVKIDLRSTSVVVPTSDYFVRLDSVANISGGTPALRDRISSVLVGRAPQSGDIRTITCGDVSLKLRQFGINPVLEATICGAASETVQVGVATATSAGVHSVASTANSVPSVTPAQPDVRRDETVDLTISDGTMLITARAIARDSGSIGDTIRIRRAGTSTDLSVVITGPHSVSLEN